MSVTMEKNLAITELLNSSFLSIKNVVPVDHEIKKPRRLEHPLRLQFGVLIGITGDVKGKLVMAGDSGLFSMIGEKMFGMPLEGEMLSSFSGELGNMIAGGMATIVVEKGLQIDITSPTILQGDTMLTGYKLALQVTTAFDKMGELDINLLLD
ncbi:CheY-P phosphatase CheX [Lentibacillus populi]|uniref:CheY-P phosphatase CheX n=1 Tax=Lentibacillus populi TaxID=1827502 RepID=A0A9W5TVX0_9BACI|nr:CheY-P phosphatase CheX [Lentibacillus populi]